MNEIENGNTVINKKMIALEKSSDFLNGLHFVCLAKADKDNLAFGRNLQNIKIESNRAYATDGHRLHIFKAEFPAEYIGMWEVVKNTKTMLYLKQVEDEPYPDIDVVMPNPADKRLFTIDIKLDDISIHSSFANIIRSMCTNGTLNFHYFEDLCKFDLFVKVWEVYDETPEYSGSSKMIPTSSEPVMFESVNDDLTALIMPMRC